MSRHGKRAETTSLISVIIDADLKERLAILAKKENRTLSNFAAYELGKIVAQSALISPATATDLAEIRRALKSKLGHPTSPAKNKGGVQ
jgi:predicted transcriptional regulator